MKKIKIGYDEHLKKDVYKIIFDKVPDKRLFNSSDVIFGNPSSNVAIAFVYTWKEDKAPAEINNLFIKLSNYAAVIGYWRTTNGGKYVFANILSNPNINKLVVLVFEKEDNGHLLVNALRNLWTNGVDKEGIIINSKCPNPKIEGISNEALDRARKQADLVVMNNIKDISKVEDLIKAQIQEPKNAVPVHVNIEFYSNYHKNKLLYDDGARFDKPYKVDFSSVAQTVKFDKRKFQLAQSIEVENLDEAIEQVAAFIFGHGDMTKDQRGIKTFEYRSFSLTVKNALSKMPKHFSSEYLKKYVEEFIDNKGKTLDEFVYTYHDRIFKK